VGFIEKYYLNPIEACHTNASSKKKTGIIGKTSIIGLKSTYDSGSFATNIFDNPIFIFFYE